MSAITIPCAESVSPNNPHLLTAPHVVHVRFDSFVLVGNRTHAPLFRIRLRPVPVDELYSILKSFTPAGTRRSPQWGSDLGYAGCFCV